MRSLFRLASLAALAAMLACDPVRPPRPVVASTAAPSAAAAVETTSCAAAESAVVGLDHVPIAVANLDSATRTYRDLLGFSIKPGRPHANSLLNNHLKFRDGSALELITASEPRDDLARDYLDFLRGGEGGAYLSLDGGPVQPVAEAIRAVEPEHRTGRTSYSESLTFPDEHALGYLFFITIHSRPPDLPEHLSHANGAARLAAVWLTRADAGREARMLERLGARACPSTLALPLGRVDREIRLARGGLYVVRAPGAPPGRPIAGVTVEVASLEAARRAIRLPPDALQRGRDARGEWLRVPPSRAHGVWVELLVPASAPAAR